MRTFILVITFLISSFTLAENISPGKETTLSIGSCIKTENHQKLC